MTLVTGYAVYFGGGGSGSDAKPGDGVSGGSLVLEFDPNFAVPKSRGVVSFPELGKREGGFFSLEGVSYFVPDDTAGLPIEYEGRIVALACAEPVKATCQVETSPSETSLAELAKLDPKPRPQAEPQPQLQPQLEPQPKPAIKVKTPPPMFYDLPLEPDGGEPLKTQAPKSSNNEQTPDQSLSASLRGAFQQWAEDDEATSVEPAPTIEEEPAPEAPSRDLPPLHLSHQAKQSEVAEYFGQTPDVVAEPEEDDWAVYLAPQPTIKLDAPARQMIEIYSPVKEPEFKERPLDSAIDLELVGDERETFALMAKDIVETVESFESPSRSSAQSEDAPKLIAELRKLDPNEPDKRPRKLLPWIKRNETEEEMLERLTIKAHRHAS